MNFGRIKFKSDDLLLILLQLKVIVKSVPLEVSDQKFEGSKHY